MRHFWRRHRVVLALAAVLIVACFFRMYRLGTLPLGLHDDEVWNTYIARYILENGHDLTGHCWPLLYTDKFGDYPPVLPMYFSGVASYIFGVNALASRWPLAILGIVSVWLFYLIMRRLAKPWQVALLSALFLAVCPWHVILSRASAENIAGLAVFLAGFYCLVRAWPSRKMSWWLLVGVCLLFLTYFFYPSYRVIIPLFFLSLCWAAPHGSIRRAMVVCLAVSCLSTVMISQTTWGQGRYQQVSLLTHNHTIADRALNYSLALGSGHVWRARVLNHRYVLAAREFLRQYATYFSPGFLAGQDYIQPARYALMEHGVTYWCLIIVFFAVVVAQFARPCSPRQIKEIFPLVTRKLVWCLAWFGLLAVLPGALTLEEVPNIHRTLGAVLFWALLFGVGVYSLSEIYFTKKVGRWVGTSLLIILVVEVVYFWHAYTSLTYESTFVFRDDSKLALMKTLLPLAERYERIYVPDSGNLALTYLFAKKDFSPDLTGKFDEHFQVDELDNLHFTDSPCSELLREAKTGSDGPVLVVSAYEPCRSNEVKFQPLMTIVRPNDTQAYFLYETATSEAIVTLDD